ncbi:glycosyltransferase family 39 protein [Nonomuraea pusilla]|uniref:Mannosyltransferase n=1 Tax=Nonomuraea pusilla TaxID=46177 RepID=A0A1H8F5K0_9ACTN|nr:glycosyltransferase family 39 protein [Nonomuraea pusilla]SEN26348.1 mannosyltransferase [Nonomuraea pusilla]
MTTAATLAPPVRPATKARSSLPWWAALLAGAAAFSGNGAATLNGDEIATISAASRSIGGLWELARHIDGHFLPYYLFMHVWSMAGTSELWLRLPSALAVAVAAGFLVDLGRRVHSTRAGLVGAAVFALLPSVSYYGAFARSYAFAAAAVVLSFWALHRAVERRDARGWVTYGIAVALVCCTHLFAVLTLPAHLALARRDVLARMLPALAVGGVPAAVLGLVGFGERHAISWIPQRGPEVLLKFPKMAAGTTVAGVLLFTVALAGAALLWPRARGWAAALLGWLVLPPVLLLAVSHLVTPVYVDRYLFVTAPALALLAGAAVAALPRFGTAAGVALALLVVGVSVPDHVAVREENGRFENIPWALRVIKAQRDDAIVYGQSQLRAGFEYYADSLMPVDVLKAGDAPAPDGFAYPERPDVAAALEGRDRVWVVWRGTKQEGLADGGLSRVAEVRRAGFEPAWAKHSADLPGLTVALFTR